MSNTSTALGLLGELNDIALDATDKQVSDDALNMSRNVSTSFKVAGVVAAMADPAMAAFVAAQQAKEDGADVGEQISQAIRAGIKRADNVAVSLAAGVAGGITAPVASAAAGHFYAESSPNKAFDSTVDTLADEMESPTTNVQGYRGYDQPGFVNQGFRSLNRTR